MPSQLLRRLSRYLDRSKATQIMALEASPRKGRPPHWPPNLDFGSPMKPIQCIVIHETSGTPAFSAVETFMDRYTCRAEKKDIGIGPQYFIETNGTVFVLIGDPDLTGTPRKTWHAGWDKEHIDMNSYALGIENADIGDSTLRPGNGSGPAWWALSTQAEDLTGMKAYLTLFGEPEKDVQLIWIAQFPKRWVKIGEKGTVPAHWSLESGGPSPGFQGAGDISDGINPLTDRRVDRPRAWRNMLFTERNYRSLALLCRLLAEQHGIPRNFPLLPYLSADDRTNAAHFRKLILSDQRREQIATKLGTTTADIQANGEAFRTRFYSPASAPRIWSRFFGWDPLLRRMELPCFRGILSHEMNGGHACPGPLFDWHRFAREVWDWWWFPFDIESAVVTTTRRPYRQARKNTQLIDYYYDADAAAADYARLHPPRGLNEKIRERFLLPDFTPVYAMANGVVVAARFALSNNPQTSGFLLVRHEVFYRASSVSNRIDYDLAPTYVWSLTYFLDNPNFRIDQIGGDNPDWLDRFVLRLRECELAIALHHAANSPNPVNAVSAIVGAPLTIGAANALQTALNRGWSHNPSGSGPRAATGQEIERDADYYGKIADALQAGKAKVFPLETNPDTTPVRVILGDFLGQPNRMAVNQTGIHIEIFSKEELPVPGRSHQAVLGSTEEWWRDASAATRHEDDAAKDLPADGEAWHYGVTDFLEWTNSLTWASEWEKYGAAGAPSVVPPRPASRRVT